MKSILFSNKNFGGAEIYVRTLKKKFNIDFISMKNINSYDLLKLLVFEDRIIFHDLRAAFLKIFRPLSSDLIVIHGPGKIKFITILLVNLLRLLNSEIILVSDELFSMFKLKYNLHLLKNYSSFEDLQLGKNNKDFVYFGRLENSKGVNLLVEHWRDNVTDKKLHIIGDGKLFEHFKKMKIPNVILYGSLSQENIKKIIQKNCRFYISLSSREGLSLSLLEALSCGLIPIVINIPTQTFIKKDYGFELIDSNLGNLNELIFKYREELLDSISKQIVNNFSKYSNQKVFNSFWKKRIY